MAVDVTTGVIQSRKDYENDPSGQYRYWCEELKASDKNLRDFRNDGTKIVTRYKGGKRTGRDSEVRAGRFRLNLFHSNAATLQSMLYGNLPKIDASRRHSDPNDDVGRVAALIMERVLNNDVKDNPETYNSVLKAALQDRLLPGLGCARVRYEYDEATQREDAPLEYYHWRDVAWGWARTFEELPWIGYRSFLSKDQIRERWGDDAAEGIQLEKQSTTPDKDEATEVEDDGPWQMGAIWEIWDRKKKQVIWVSIGYDKVLETKPDFLKIAGFLPSPAFLMANQTTTIYVPTSDYYLAQDLYNEIDTLQTRISIITEAVKVVGVYNSAAKEIKRMFKEGSDNDLIPVDNWALFAESGGVKGQIDWVPVKDIVESLSKLQQIRDEQISLLQQITGMSDIMRGQLDNQYEGVGQSKDKTKFGSIRIQALQEEFAAFASNLMQIKANIIGVHYSPETIARLANVSSFVEADQELIPQAIQLIKRPSEARLHIKIRPESVAMIDYAQLKAERTEYLTGISTFLQAASPIMEVEPATAPFMLQLLQWGLAGFKGAAEIEGVVDKAIQVAQDNAEAQKDKPDPQEEADQRAKQLEQIKHRNKLKEIDAKLQADLQTREADKQADIAIVVAELQAQLKEIQAKMAADIKAEAITSQINAEQEIAGIEGETEKGAFESVIEIEKAGSLADIEIDKARRMPKPGGSDA